MTDTYEYDTSERLLGLDLQTAVNPSDRGRYDYSYDARTRRVSRGKPGGSMVLNYLGGVSLRKYAARPGTTPTSIRANDIKTKKFAQLQINLMGCNK